jgi:hypothetical protein
VAEWHIQDEGEIGLEGLVEVVDAHLVAGLLSIAVSDGPPRILLSGIRGGPVIVSHNGGSLMVRHVSGTASTRSPSDGLAGLLDNVIGGIFGAIGGRYAEVAIMLPAPARVSTRTTSAEMMISGMLDSSAETVSGSLTASGIRGSLRLTSVSGPIVAGRIDGRLWLKTVSGEMTIAGANLSELSAHTVSGDLVADADLHEGTHTFRGVSGGLALRLDPSASLDLDATSVSGALACGIGEPEDISRPGNRRLRVRTGDGRARVRAHSVSGDLTIVARDDSVIGAA